MLHVQGVRILLALLTVVSVSLIGTYFAQAAPPTPTHIYLPLVNCPTCRGSWADRTFECFAVFLALQCAKRPHPLPLSCARERGRG
jgi:hypothetical protein